MEQEVSHKVLEEMFGIQDKSTRFMASLNYDEHISKNLMMLLFHLRLYRHMKITEIAEAFMLTPGAATNMCDKLEELDYVERVRIKDDRRVVRVSLTKKGEQKVESIFVKYSQAELEHISKVLAEINVLFSKL
ncbi:MarR family transcriptional regulator [Psychrobacillus sp.]|uniref:MarR family winged helix-turn-helix transcriptional regulator n=1 Tax=Psychrobacillus sp. TaxID=1871623 RepID=UPI0028BEA2A4|nr:MarR family transcriptional regulator [Psychrobacillus sp.]